MPRIPLISNAVTEIHCCCSTRFVEYLYPKQTYIVVYIRASKTGHFSIKNPMRPRSATGSTDENTFLAVVRAEVWVEEVDNILGSKSCDKN
jgi:hypothetical protein